MLLATFALACLSSSSLTICFAWDCPTSDDIAVEILTGRDLVQRREVACTRNGFKTDSSRLFAELLFALRPPIAYNFPHLGIGSRWHSPELTPKLQRASTCLNEKQTSAYWNRPMAVPTGSRRKRFSTAAMIAIEVTTPWVGAIAVASAHGLTDFRWRPRELAPYLCMFAPIPTELVTAFFIYASIAHFSHDIGMKPSLLLHLTFIGLAPVMPEVAWSIFAFYYCACHAPLHVVRHYNDIDARLAAMLLAFAIMSGLAMQGVETFVLTDTMQLGVLAHIIVDEMQENSVSRCAESSQLVASSHNEAESLF